MTDTQRQLLCAIITTPEDDGARLAYADYIHIEYGDEDRADFIRIQCELARRTLPISDQKTHSGKLLKYDHGNDWEELLRREGELLTGENSGRWAGHPISMGRPNQTYPIFHPWEFTCGFISSITCTAQDFLKYADQLVWSENMTQDCDGCQECFEGWPIIGNTKCPLTGKEIPLVEKRGKRHQVPRPMPDTAQPIRRVILTTAPIEITETWSWRLRGEWSGNTFDKISTARDWHDILDTFRQAVAKRFGDIEFKLPRTIFLHD